MDRKQLLEKIIAREAAMFIAVKASEPADCQEMLKTFYLMREMSHSVLAADTLTSYLQDLEKAGGGGGTAAAEGVDSSRVRDSIRRGLKQLAKYF